MAVCSPNFFNSEYCGKEYAAFLDRLARAPNPPAGGRAIFPVACVPSRKEMPAEIKRFQFDHARLPGGYAEIGLRPLFHLLTDPVLYQSSN